MPFLSLVSRGGKSAQLSRPGFPKDGETLRSYARTVQHHLNRRYSNYTENYLRTRLPLGQQTVRPDRKRPENESLSTCTAQFHLGSPADSGRAGNDPTSVVAVLRGSKPGPTVLLRGDMDALPMKELTDLPFASTNGAMHSCGHDLHTTGLIGAAKLLAAHREELPGNVVFMFQPGEEGEGVARMMIDEGVLDASGERAIAAYAIHVAPGPKGVFATKRGCATASSNQMFITVKGRGGHGSQPLNVIPDTVTLAATIRSLTDESLARVRDRLKGVAESTAQAYGMEVDYDFVTLYPPTNNDDQTTDWAVEDMRSQMGDERVVIISEPMMGSEDFAFVSAQVPGTFVGPSASPPEIANAQQEWLMGVWRGVVGVLGHC